MTAVFGEYVGCFLMQKTKSPRGSNEAFQKNWSRVDSFSK